MALACASRSSTEEAKSVKVVLGRVVGAHGVRGEIRVRYFGDGPENLLAAAEVALAAGKQGAGDPAPLIYKIEGGGTGRGGEVRLRLSGLANRDAAQALRGRLVLGEAAALAPLAEGEHYWYQLVGCHVVTEGGEPLGTVCEIWETGAHDVLVVETEEGQQHLIPTARRVMREVDPEGRRIVITALPGLID